MFDRARRRLTVAYLALFATLLALFSAVFFAIFVIVVQPNFDFSPETESDQVAQVAIDEAVRRTAVILLAADALAILLVGIGSWFLAGRTLKPIRAAHERQRRFVADASHQMRTPLTVIRSSAEAALGEAASDEERVAALRTVSDAAAELGNMTAGLLALAEADESVTREPAKRCDLSVVVAERLALRAAAPGPRPAVALSPNLVVTARADDLGRIVDNLVDNAYRHGGDGVVVGVSTHQLGGRAVLEVSDNGPGISAADIAHVFEPFYRARSDANATPGTGLGLAIAADLAKRNGAQLTVASPPAGGATFRLAMPLAG